MSRLVRFFSMVLLLAVLLAGFVFASFNTMEVPLWVGRELAARPVGQWVIAAFLLGALTGWLLGFGPWGRIKSRARVRQLNARLRAAESEIESLKNNH